MLEKDNNEILEILKRLGRPFAINLLLNKGKLALMNNDFFNAKVTFETVLEFDSKNKEAKEVLEEIKKRLETASDPIGLLIHEFINKYYPNEIINFNQYWHDLSLNSDLLAGNILYSESFGLTFAGREIDIALRIIFIFTDLIKKGVLTKKRWKVAKLRAWVIEETKNYKAEQDLLNKLILYLSENLQNQ